MNVADVILGSSAVVFDMDGVLIDSEPFHNKAGELALRRLEIDLPDEGFSRYTGWGIKDIHADMASRYGIKVPFDRLFSESEKAIQEVFADGAPSIDGAIELVWLLHARGKILALASSSSRQFVESTVERLGIRGFLIAVLNGQDVTRTKPDPQIYLLAAERLGKKPAECVAIEDTDVGVASAKAAGMTVVGYMNPHAHATLEKADVVVDSFKELIKQF
ncbi:MAG: HAD family phosphatase [archaeon]